MVDSISYDQITDSHLAKKFNDVLYDCIMRVNVTGYLIEAEPHYDNLKAYFAAVYILYRNTFMLFYTLPDKKFKNRNLAQSLMSRMKEIKAHMKLMKTRPFERTPEQFEEIVADCDILHMAIMDGLQRRHMLVRISESEPRGESSVLYWEQKEAFRSKRPKHKIIEEIAQASKVNFFMRK